MSGFASAQAVLDLIECPRCGGAGEIGTRQDYFGNWDTEQCRCCHGAGEVSPLTTCVLPLASALSDSTTEVDALDFAAADQHRWYLGGGRKAYAVTTVRDPRKRMLYLHRLVAARAGLLPADDGAGHLWTWSVDHIDGDKLNNRRSNLRVADRATQSGNPADGARRTSGSGHRGVYLDRMAPGLPWHAQGTIRRRTVNLGRYATVEEAIAARRTWEIEVGRCDPPDRDDF